MEALADRYADRAVRSVFLYTREAHPAENLRPIESMDDKRSHAGMFRDEANIRRQILLDDVEGTAHRAYGTLPNMTWIVSRGGVIQYKASWTDVNDVEDALKQTLDQLDNRIKGNLMPFYSERTTYTPRDMDRFREGLVRAGPQAVDDMKRAMEAGAARGGPPQAPGSFYKPDPEEAEAEKTQEPAKAK